MGNTADKPEVWGYYANNKPISAAERQKIKNKIAGKEWIPATPEITSNNYYYVGRLYKEPVKVIDGKSNEDELEKTQTAYWHPRSEFLMAVRDAAKGVATQIAKIAGPASEIIIKTLMTAGPDIALQVAGMYAPQAIPFLTPIMAQVKANAGAVMERGNAERLASIEAAKRAAEASGDQTALNELMRKKAMIDAAGRFVEGSIPTQAIIAQLEKAKEAKRAAEVARLQASAVANAPRLATESTPSKVQVSESPTLVVEVPPPPALATPTPAEFVDIPMATPVAAAAYEPAYTGAYLEFLSNFNVTGGKIDKEIVDDYLATTNQAARNALIDTIFEALSHVGYEIKGKTRSEKIEHIVASLPKKTKVIGGKEARPIMLKLANAINGAFHSKVIDTSKSTKAMIKDLLDTLTSLNMDVGSEHIMIVADIVAIMANLRVAINVLETLYQRTIDQVRSETDSESKLAMLKGAHEQLIGELRRQLNLLETITSTRIPSSEKALADIMARSEDNMGSILSRINSDDADLDFGTAITRSLLGVGITLEYTEFLNKSLNELGISMKEYLSMDPNDLRNKLNEALMKLPDSKGLYNYIEKTGILLKNIPYRKRIGEVVQSMKGGMETYDDILKTNNYAGGDDKPPMSDLDKRVFARKELGKIALKTFARRLIDIYDKDFVPSLEALMEQIGTRVPLTDKLTDFAHALSRLEEGQMTNRNIVYALSGYFNDAESKSKRDELVGTVGLLLSYLNELVVMPEYKSSGDLMSPLQGAFRKLNDLLAKYPVMMTEKFGNYEGGCCGELPVGADEEQEIAGGAPDDPKYEDVRIVRRSALSVMEAINKFYYRYRVAQMRSNISHMSKELPNYGAEYENKLLANSVAKYLEDKRKIYDANMKVIADKFLTATPETKFGADPKTAKKNVEAYMTHQWDALKGLWDAMQAVDIWMMSFTTSVTANLDDVKSIKAMLDKIEVISNWYDSDLGNDIVLFFETTFGNFLESEGKDLATAMKAGKHYYTWMTEKSKSPSSVEKCSETADPNADMKKLWMRLTVLKNILSVFTHVGDKLGGVDVHKKVFLSPAQLYNKIVEFLVASSLKLSGNFRLDLMPVGVDAKPIPDGEIKPIITSEDTQFFILMMKAIASKILVVLGLRDMLVNVKTTIFDVKLRSIVGGDSPMPKIIDGATDFYCRLPLLALFYRKFFENLKDPEDYQFKRFGEGVASKIALIPDISGIFNGFVKLMYLRLTHVDEHLILTEEELRELITEVNKIYEHFASKYKDNVIMGVYQEFIDEINRRWGIVTDDEMKRFNKEFVQRQYSSITSSQYGDKESGDIAILQGEGDESEFVMPAPSDQLLALSEKPVDTISSRYNINYRHYALVKKFRETLDKMFIDIPAVEHNTLRDTIRMTHHKLKKETDANERFKIIAALIRGVDTDTQFDRIKNLLFHETVITGLNTLSAIYTIIARFKYTLLLGDVETVTSVKAPDLIAYARTIILPEAEADKVSENAAKLRNVDVESMKTFIDLLCGFMDMSQELVVIDTDHDRILFNPANLKNTIKQMFEAIKYYMDMLRPFMPKDIMNRVTEKRTVGSYYWLYEQLMETTIIGRKMLDKADVDAQIRYTSLDELEIIMNHIWSKYLTSSVPVTFGDAISDIIHSNLHNDIITEDPKMVDLHNPYELLMAEGIRETQQLDLKYAGRFKEFYKWEGNVKYLPSIMITFNQLIGKMIRQFYDRSTKKIYVNLFNGFVNGAFNEPIIGLKKVFPDTAPAVNINVGQVKENVRIPAAWQKLEDSSSGALLKPLIDAGVEPSRVERAMIGLINARTNVNSETILPSLLDWMRALIKNLERSFGRDHALRIIAAIIDTLTTNIRTDADAVNFIKQTSQNLGALTIIPPAELRYLTYAKVSDLQALSSIDIKGGASYSVGDSALIWLSDDTRGLKADWSYSNLLGAPAVGVTHVAEANVLRPKLGDPNANSILFASLALILKNLHGVRDEASKTAAYLAESLADVQMYMKEKMRVQLPMFKNLLRELAMKANFMKKILDSRKLGEKLTRSADPAVHNIFPFSLTKRMDADVSSDKTIARLRGILDAVINGITTLIASCDQVLREVGDDPKFFELYSGSIKAYKTQYNKEPLMPISTILHMFKELTPTADPGVFLIDYSSFLPSQTLGETMFKYHFGIRQFIHRPEMPMTLATTYGFGNIIQMYNSSIDVREQVKHDMGEMFVNNIAKLLRFAFSGEYIKSIFNRTNLYARSMALPTAIAGEHLTHHELVSIVNDDKHVHAYSVFEKPENVISIIEGDKEIGIKTISKCVKSNTKEDIVNNVLMNVIDLNVMPINVHALLREIPLANIYNYAYTFDMLIDDIIGIELPAEKILNEFMKDTWSVQTLPQYWRNIFNGAVKLFGRPRFLSDQLWNKALYMTQYNAPNAVPVGTDIPVPEVGPLGHTATDDNQVEIGNNLTIGRPRVISPNIVDRKESKPDYVDNSSLGRFNTLFIRYIMYIVNIYRIIRLVLHQELINSKNSRLVASANEVVSPALTELYNNEVSAIKPSDYTPGARRMINM